MIRVRQVKVSILDNSNEVILRKTAKKLKIKESSIKEFEIRKQSLDARNKDDIYFVYEVDVKVDNEDSLLMKNGSSDIFRTPDEEYKFPKAGDEVLKDRIVIIGSGPAGLLCGYLLAEMGYKPLIIERGKQVDDRIKDVDSFFQNGNLNINSNVQFGEGGAGTFSDGKLNTLVKDEMGRGRKVFSIFVECGAPRDILYSYKPHIGTDILRTVIKNMRNKIIDMGGDFLYESLVTDINVINEKVESIIINNSKIIKCDNLVLAIGHSARDTFKMLFDKGFQMEAKPFAVGVRVQHSQDMINESQYGVKYKDLLPAASYKLTYTTNDKRGVYSFCMCPGGYVVNASSEEGHLAINGMSYHKRDSENANSAIVVTVFPRDFGNNPLDGLTYQRNLEKLAYNAGKGNIPIQLLKDFYDNQISCDFNQVKPIFKGSYTFGNLNEILPKEINDALKEAFPYFGRKIKGFDKEDTILAAVESRTSSPVKILRNEDFESNIKGVYPCGEGAGYAGGITSAAIDGIKVAEAIIKKYKANKNNS